MHLLVCFNQEYSADWHISPLRWQFLVYSESNVTFQVPFAQVLSHFSPTAGSFSVCSEVQLGRRGQGLVGISGQ